MFSSVVPTKYLTGLYFIYVPATRRVIRVFHVNSIEIARVRLTLYFMCYLRPPSFKYTRALYIVIVRTRILDLLTAVIHTNNVL